MKKCTDCKETKEETEFRFHKRNTSTGGFYSTQCRLCISKDKKIWVELNWYKVNESNKQYNKRFAHVIRGNKLAKYWPGTNWEQATEKYAQLFASQNGVCAICLQKENRAHKMTGAIWELAVDHCHKTNKVRGLLCNACNRGMGLLDDTIEGLTRALEYLKKSSWLPPHQCYPQHMTCNKCGKNPHKNQAERRPGINKGFYYRDNRGRLWNGNTCPTCYYGVRVRKAPVKAPVLESKESFANDPLTSRKCRMCQSCLPQSRYLNCYDCQPELPHDPGLF